MTPIAAESLVFAEQNGVSVEAAPVVADASENSPTPDPIGSSKQSSSTKPVSDLPAQLPRQPDGNGSVEITGVLK